MNYIETIKIENGQLKNVPLHRQRIKQTVGTELDIPRPELPSEGIYKYRLLYNEQSIIETAIMPYHIRPIHSLKAILCDTIDYAYKYEDRSELTRLFNLRGQADDILIIKNNCITDSSYCNLVFENTRGQLFTPSTPLLSGTKRTWLLESRQIQERVIHLQDLHLYNKVRLINAMIELTDNLVVDITHIDLSLIK